MPIGVYKHPPQCGFQKGHKLNLNKKGKKANHWKNGKTKSTDNRWMIYKSEHPFANKQKYVRQSRLVVEKILGRYLTYKEIIHHINGVKDDDRPKNLYLCSKKEHMRIERNSSKDKIKIKVKSNVI